MAKAKIIVLALVLVLGVSWLICAEKGIGFDFENSTNDWIIPDWAYYQVDYKAETVEVSTEYFSNGKTSLKIMCDFPGDAWTSAIVNWEGEIDLKGYESISVDVYLPKGAPKGFLNGRIILTIGDGWYFTEMRSAVPLGIGKWTTIKAKLDSEETEKSDWRGRGEKQLYKHITNIKKVAVRIEYDASPPDKIGPRYHGPVYIDNVIIK